MALFECVPNISDGRNNEILDECIAAACAAGAKVIHRTSDPVHHRSVLTLIGSYEAVKDAGVALAGVASKRIDLRSHRGIHPRIGALDVLPFVPLREATMEQAVQLAREAGQLIWEKFAIPSFLYGEAARTPGRRNLAAVRSVEFEGLDSRFERPEWQPDFGASRAHRSAGAIAIGARDILIAFNVELATDDLAIAGRIARALRESSGGLRTLKALGLRLNERVVQVSLNLTQYDATPLYRVVEMIRAFAQEDGVEILRSELIGCLPRRAVATSARYYLGLSLEERRSF
ncbi:MAG: glutamate formimidoyltransferase [Candidatus Eremiobacteraeota bacterium]|nr:glutamate formimidoyltransferase [Candidatus Eremiobacteraeota bacterium]